MSITWWKICKYFWLIDYVCAWTGKSYSCTNTSENRCGKAWTWELGLVSNNYYQLITDITAFFVQNFVIDKNNV